ncbi:MAG TPA: bifunctional methylenetetrahydrofolate dehydrogenase/methenyltetrahydrofolate cyclohydrolase FolD [Burkholderiales bacterium]|jgi:methylenetetrahydrofolate dehydrogenase (NADP+)/methenyltetrahydrofolate cyclohydrolase|nr:bifunctional methylenetetrahydrofolate dehydrogenase/methenyltetrahydrofolate cyclohydrolase FolD [Burkholderiales bacterium]
MTATLMDGVAVSKAIRAHWHQRAEALRARGVTPGLAVILAGDNPASQVYVRNKVRACGEVGLYSEVHQFPANVPQETVLAKIEELNRDPKIHGILVQLPLPPHFDNGRVLDAISAEKDADGFHLYNLGGLVSGGTVFPPCTPYGVMALLDYYKIPIEGSNAVVVGRSNIVGKPMALMLLARSATVCICTSKTRDLKQFTSLADILVVATGKPKMVTGGMIKPGSTVIDVGINRLPDGKLVGDVDFEAARQRAAFITPVPGGVGPMTITMLIANTVQAAERLLSKQVRSHADKVNASVLP